MRIVVADFISLDGVVQAPGGPDEDRSEGFEHGGWMVGYWDDELAEAMGESMTPPFDLVLGRRTYEIMARHWPHTDEPGAELMNGATKHVASTTLTRLDWQNSTLLEPNVVDGIRALKAGDGPELQVHGSANLIQTLLEHELVDVYNLIVFPVVLGAGKRLFPEGVTPAGLRLTNCQATEKGVVILSYESAGKPTYGTVGVDD